MTKQQKQQKQTEPAPPDLIDNAADSPATYGLGEAPPVEVEIYHVPGNPIPDL